MSHIRTGGGGGEGGGAVIDQSLPWFLRQGRFLILMAGSSKKKRLPSILERLRVPLRFDSARFDGIPAGSLGKANVFSFRGVVVGSSRVPPSAPGEPLKHLKARTNTDFLLLNHVPSSFTKFYQVLPSFN